MTVPNLLSLFRMGLIPLFVIAILEREPVRALAIFVLAGVTDALDGVLARVLKQQSLLGTYLDPMADKLLLVSAYVLLSIPGIHDGAQIPLWVTVLVFARDLVIVVVALLLHLTMGISRFPPTLLSKLNTIAQVVAVFLVLVSAKWSTFFLPAEWASVVVGLLTVASGVDYIFRAHGLAAAASAPPAVRGQADGAGDSR